MKSFAIFLAAAVISIFIGLASAFYFVAPNSGGIFGKVREFALQMSERAFSCDSQAKIGQEIFENSNLEPEVAFSTSREWFDMALSCNSVVALDHLGYMYVNGFGVEKDVYKGVSMLEQARNAGYAEAAKTLAREYYSGENLP